MNPDVQRWIVPNAYHIKVAVRDGKTASSTTGIALRSRRVRRGGFSW